MDNANYDSCCDTCHFWRPEADGKNGTCSQLSTQDGFLSVKVAEDDQKAFEIVTRSDFSCNRYAPKVR